MASSASDAGHSEKLIREKLVRTGAVDIMVSIGNNFFYTRSLPCTLWFFDRAKEKNKKRRDKILMLDARKVFRKVSTTINDFSPEQSENLTAIVKLYRGNTTYFAKLLENRLRLATSAYWQFRDFLNDELAAIQKVTTNIQGLPDKLVFDHAKDAKVYNKSNDELAEVPKELQVVLQKLITDFKDDEESLQMWEGLLNDSANAHNALHNQWLMLHQRQQQLQPDVKHAGQLYKQWLAAWEAHEKEYNLQRHKEVLDLQIKPELRQGQESF